MKSLTVYVLKQAVWMYILFEHISVQIKIIFIALRRATFGEDYIELFSGSGGLCKVLYVPV